MTERAASDNMRSVVGFVARSPERCWRAFTDGTSLPAWVPGLRRARVIASRPDGLPLEILFEFSPSLTYSLVYGYDLDERKVTWEPRVGKRDAVRGFARIEPWDGGSRLTYGLEVGDGRDGRDVALADPRTFVAAFARWIESARPTAVALG